jgi:hypothetical protein
MTKVLFVNHSVSNVCGVFSLGQRIARILLNFKDHTFYYIECNDLETFGQAVKSCDPSIVIYNYMPPTMPWASHAKDKYPNLTHIALAHDATQEIIDSNTLLWGFDYRIALDPTFKENGNWFKLTRPLFNYTGKNTVPVSDIPKIGSYGLFFPHKNFDFVVNLVKHQLEQAEVNLHIVNAHFSPYTDDNLKTYCNYLHSIVRGTKIKLNITNNNIDDHRQIDFLAGNDLNIFAYDNNNGMGPASVIDYSVAAGKPILINNSYQFRHVKRRLPTIMDYTIKQALQLGNAEVLKLRDEWSEYNFYHNYRRIINEVQNRQQ